MWWMGRVPRSLAAALAIFALVAMLPAPCPCPEETAAPARGHECCAPPAGVSSNEHGCCDEPAAEADVLTPAPGPAPSLGETPVARVVPVARLQAGPRRPVVAVPSPPPSILRL
jgi:hypothetical protein